MEKKKNKILTIIATSVLTLATGISLATSIAGLAAIDSSVLVNLSSPTFYATYGSGDAAVPFACFVLNDEEISVAWGSDNPEDTPTDLYVPPTLTNEETGNTYIVKAVQDAGFRYCDFETISLPSSITAIGKEAFAYCVNLKEFYLPQFLTKIESSTFLDCRALKDLYFSSYANISFGNDAPVTSTAGNYYIKEGNTNVLYKKNWTAITSDLEVVTQNGDDFTQVSTTKNYIYNTTTRHLYHLENSAWVRVTSVSFGSASPSSSTTMYYLQEDNGTRALYSKSWDAQNASIVEFDNGAPQAAISGKTYYVDEETYQVYKYSSSWTDESGSYTKAFGNKKITEIGDHAFDSCVSLRIFSCPENLQTFGVSCFQNCSALANFNFPAAKYNGNTVTNRNIVVNQYAFAYCSSLTTVYMEENINIIYNYAFIECNDALQFSFTGKKANYKRKESHNEMFYFDGAPSSNTIGAHRDQCIYWRNKKLATNYVSTGSDVTNKYTVLDQQAITLGADNYPGLRYVTSTEDSLLDSAYTNETGVTVVTGGEEYAIIKKFTTPSIYVEDYYEQVIIDGTTYNKLTIPEEIDGKAVKIIDSTAFQSNNDIQIVKFSKNLVQIKNKAFYKCPNIAQLDFDSCENLIEISYSVFQDNNYKTTNQVTSLRLPYCLEYLGDYAFAYFTKTNELVFDAPYVNNAPVNSSCLRVMGDMAFFNLGSAVASPNITVTLPKSLNDQDAADAKMYNFHSPWPDSYGLHENPSSRWCAVGKYAFDGALGVVTVAMEPDPDHLYKSDGTTINMDYTCSLYSNAFTRCTNLARFQANTNVKTIGNDCFKNCNNFCEAFFSSRKVDSTLDYPWAVSDNGTAYGGAMFSGTTTNLVVYIDGAKAPGKLDDLTLDSDPSNQALGHKWNAENGDSYPNELNNASNKNNDKMQYFGRSHIATFYNIDFENNNGLIYWNLHGSGNDAVNSIRTEPPTKKADYDEGVVVLAKHGEETVSNTTKSYYTVARYFTNNTASHVSSLVDLTAVPSFDYTNDEITVIGDEAFASSASLKDNVVAAGHGFILPTTIKSINERAFYRRTDTGQNYNGIHGVKVVTYRHAKDNTAASEKVMKADGSSYFTETTINNEPDTIEQYLSKISGSSNQYLYSGYCLLPDGVKVIGRNAFYNHIFGTIKIGTGLEFLGNSAFFTIPYNASKPRARTTSISIGTNSYFEVTNDGGVYYKKSATEKMLVYQTAYDTTNRTLTIQNNTIAVGMHACANTYYQTIKLPTTLTTIYGGGFQKNLSLTTVCATDNNTLSNLQYIGAMENAGGVPVASASGSFYIDLMDYRLYEKSDSTWSAVDYGLYKTGSSISGVATVWPQEAITAAIDGETNNSIYFIDLSTNKLYTYINSNWSEVASVTFSNEFYDATVAAHFDNYDYRDYAYSKRGIIESLYGAFANCTALKTLNFREMTGLKKIGYGAFSSCTNLEEMTGNPTSNASPTYNCAVYYESSGSYVKENVTGYSNLKKGVLDLTNCPNLTSIGKGAFLNCNKMKVLLLPDNKPNGATESNLYIGYDPEAKLYGQTTPPNDAILTAGKGTKVLIKEKITVANTNYSSTAKYHYNSGVFSDGTSDTSNKVYYYIASASDVPSGDTSTYHYWTYDGNSTTSFVLFETATAARAYSFS